GMCLVGTLYLNHLHVNVSDELSENVRSTLAAARLEATARQLLLLLRSPPADCAALVRPVEEQNAVAHALPQEAEALANLEHEGVVVRQMGSGLKEYLQRWDERARVPAKARRDFDLALADLLEREVLLPCIDLRSYNTGQVEQSDRENQAIVRTLRWGMPAVG